tara:strand:- start:1669 stop:2892 length:1224 start_codon:yes stop_codon:yes gene_type:complete
MKIRKCRNCKSPKLSNLFSFGKISFTGKFPQNKSKNVKKAPLELVICEGCKLVQLKHDYSLKYLYGPDYGYRTGINKTMVEHVRNVTETLIKKTNLRKNDHVLDIASNDGTLLNFYPKITITLGIDPLVNKYKKNYKNINFKISDFFSKRKILKKTKNKFKIISALSVFYDLKDPNKFMKDIEKLLETDGIALIEFADLASMIKFNMFDAICHEHITYYSSKIVSEIAKKNNLRVFDIKYNNINGGSAQYYICKENSIHKNNIAALKKILKFEKNLRLEDKKTYKKFFLKVKKIKNKINSFIKKAKLKNKSIHGYGASTKGNVLLQYFDINKKHIDFVADRNPKKFGCYTPGSKIPIISEKKSRKLKPDFYLVLPWHFKKEILERERKTRLKGSKFVFPLPNLEIYK